MKKTTYLEKLATTVITDENTVGEAKAAKRTETALKRYLKNAALAHIEKTATDNLLDSPWVKVEFDFNLKPTGSVTVRLFDLDSHNPNFAELKHYTVRKSDLFN